MNAGLRPTPIIVLAGMLIGGTVCPDLLWASDLELAMHFELESESHYVAVTNESRQFLCIAEHVLDTKRGYISLSSIDGQPISVWSHADSAPNLYRGVDLAKAYFFLRPGERRKMYIDLTNFATHGGTYQYRIVFPYYACKDIIDTRGAARQREIPTRAVDVSGTIQIRP